MREFQEQMTRFGPNVLHTIPGHQISLGAGANNLNVSKEPKNQNLKFLVTVLALLSVMQISPQQLQHSHTPVRVLQHEQHDP